MIDFRWMLKPGCPRELQWRASWCEWKIVPTTMSFEETTDGMDGEALQEDNDGNSAVRNSPDTNGCKCGGECKANQPTQ